MLGIVALLFGVSSPAFATTGSIQGTQYENSWYYYNSVRTNSYAQNTIQFDWSGNDAGGGGGIDFCITNSVNTKLGCVTPAANTWYTLYDSYAGQGWFPSGGFYTAAYVDAACGSPCNGNGYVTFYGTLAWNQPY